MNRVNEEILCQIDGYEAAADPGPWFAQGQELYYGNPGSRTTSHQQIGRESNAILIAVLRSWIKDLIADLREARAELIRRN